MIFGTVDWFDSLAALLNKFWGSLNISILWQWLPNDIQSWIAVFISILFLLALKRVVIT